MFDFVSQLNEEIQVFDHDSIERAMLVPEAF
jgi:hypothetical protein